MTDFVYYEFLMIYQRLATPIITEEKKIKLIKLSR